MKHEELQHFKTKNPNHCKNEFEQCEFVCSGDPDLLDIIALYDGIIQRTNSVLYMVWEETARLRAEVADLKRKDKTRKHKLKKEKKRLKHVEEYLKHNIDEDGDEEIVDPGPVIDTFDDSWKYGSDESNADAGAYACKTVFEPR